MPLRELSLSRLLAANTVGAPSATTQIKNTIAVPHTGSGNSVFSSGCPEIFHEDFEGSTVALYQYSSGNTDEWEVDDLSAVSKPPGLPDACSQGSFCAITNSKSNYDDNAESVLITPVIDFTSYPTPIMLTFDLAYDLEPTFDGMRIMAAPDFGDDWYLVTPQGGYPPAKSPYGDLTSNVGVFEGTPGYSGDSGGWVAVIVDLGPMLAISPHWAIAFEFASDYSINKAGIAIDNIRVIPYCRVTATLTATSTSTLTRTPTQITLIPTTEVAPPPNEPATPCPPTHPC